MVVGRAPLQGVPGRAVASPRPVPRRERHDLRAQGGAARRGDDRVRRPPASGDDGPSRGDRGRPRRVAGAVVRDPDDRVPRVLDPVPPTADALPAGAGPVPRPAARRDGVAAHRPAPGRRLLGGLLARQHPVPPRWRQGPGVPGGRRDQRDPPDPVRRPAGLRPRDPRRERRVRPRRRGRDAGTPGLVRRRRRRGGDRAHEVRLAVGGAPLRPGGLADRPARGASPHPPAQRPRLRGRRDPPGARGEPAPGRSSCAWP